MKLNFQKIGMLGVGCWFVAAAAIAGDEQPKFGAIFEGSFVNAPVTMKLEGARRTQLTAAYRSVLGVKLFKKEEWQEAGWTWDQFFKESSKAIEKLAEDIKPLYVRDSRQVIEYAIIKSENPFLSSVITSSKFVKPFENTLGKKLHVIVLDRNVLYVFPASGGNLGDYAEALRETFKMTPLPVSLEIFEVTQAGFRVIGEIEQPIKTQIEGPKN